MTLVASRQRYGLDGAWNAPDHSCLLGSSIVPIAPHSTHWSMSQPSSNAVL